MKMCSLMYLISLHISPICENLRMPNAFPRISKAMNPFRTQLVQGWSLVLNTNENIEMIATECFSESPELPPEFKLCISIVS